MIVSDEVGVIFKIINEASQPLKLILAQVRELNKAISTAKKNMAELSKFSPGTGLKTAVTETEALAKAWKSVAAESTAARRAIGSATSASARAALPPAARGGGGGRHQPGFLARGGGAHIGGPGIPIPGGGHVRGGGVGMATAGMAGYAAYEAAEIEDTIWQLIYHSGQENNEANRQKFRTIVQNAMRSTGFGVHDIGEAAKQEIRMFQGTPGGGIDVLPEMLKAAAIEARVKGESPEESMKALIGLAHMTKQYGPDDIKKLAPAFAFLSTANPGSLGSIEKAAGYAVPLLQSGLEIDPLQSLLLGTALTRAGATSTKSGTWLREMALRAMPGSALMSDKAFQKHEDALHRLGLVDDKDKPTWFSDGKPDLLKMLGIAGTNAANIPLTERAALERQLFGAQGGGGFALLADPAVREQIAALTKDMNSPEFKNRYGSFLENYNSQVTAQSARTGMQEFNVLMQDLGQHVLPAVNGTLRDFRSILEGVRSVLPGGPKSEATIGTRVLEGALAGGAVGAFGGPGGVVGGAALGAAAGGVLGTAEQFMASQNTPVDRFGRATVITGNSAAQAAEGVEALARAIRGLPGKGSVFPGGTSPAPIIKLDVNIDGRAIGSAVSEQLNYASQYHTVAPASNPLVNSD
jgi:hypothetical protein